MTHSLPASQTGTLDENFVRLVRSPTLEAFASLLEEFLRTDSKHLWIVDEQVFYEGDQDALLARFSGCNADLLATVVRSRDEDPDWHWWRSLATPDEARADSGVAAMLPFARFSQAAAQAVDDGLRAGWTGHPEAVVPTLVSRAGLTIEDIGGIGSFTPSARIAKWYDPRTWNWQPPVEHVPGKLHFPVPFLDRSHSAKPLVEPYPKSDLRLLFVSPVGKGAAPLIRQTLARFEGARADCMLLQYEEANLDIPTTVRVIRDRGFKWQLAQRHLPPDAVADYDYIFYWDDDLDTDGFDPVRFARIMMSNRLSIAQPAIKSPHWISHSITAQHPVPPPRRFRSSPEQVSVVGRLTNFVEIMAPVFSRDGWVEFHSYLTEDNRSGWGYDYIPMARKGIIDSLPVIHTRSVQSINADSEADLRRFLDQHGLFRHEAVAHGQLFEQTIGDEPQKGATSSTTDSTLH
jgi:hypothetical protein